MENATTERVGRASDPRPEKVAAVDEVRQRLDGTSATILTEYRGLNVTKLADLRNALRAAGGDFKVYKNTLVRFAARDLGLEIEDLLVGPTALAFVTDKPDGSPGDAVDVAKVLKDFGKDNPALVVKGGILGQDLLSAADASALAEVEPREVLLAKLAGGMAAPMQKFAGLLQALPRNMAYGLKALIDQGGAPGAPADAPPATDGPTDPSEPSASEAESNEADAGSVPAGADEERAGTPDDEGSASSSAPAEEPAAESVEDTATDSTPDQTEEQAADEVAAENTEEQES